MEVLKNYNALTFVGKKDGRQYQNDINIGIMILLVNR